jgi:TP901 family phage tail tape measure protein
MNMADNMDIQINITGTNETAPSFESLQSSINSITESFNSASRVVQSFSESMSRVGQAGQEAGRAVESGMQAAQQGMRNTSDAINNTSSSVDRLGQALSAEMIGEQLKNIGETGMHAFEGMVEAAADFEYNISRIGAVLTTVGKASNSQMQQMSDDALKIGSTSSFSANQIAEGMYTLARQGLDATTILGDGVNGAINVVNDLAQATDSDMTDTATVITDVVHEYGLSGAELRNVANIMSGALHNSSESLDDFYQSMKQVGPVAANMHQNAMDMSTALALLAQHGITGSSAGTALKNMLLGLQPHTKKAAALMKELGISTKEGAADSFYQLNGNLKPLPEIIDILNKKYGGLNDSQKQAALAATFTKYGLAGLNVVVGESRDKFLEFQNELRADDAATIAAKKMDNLHGDLLKFNAGVQTMMKSFGDSINGMLRPIVQGASEAIKWITELPKPVKEMGMAFLGIGSALAIAGGSIIAFAGGVKMLGPTLEMAGMSTAGLEAAAGALGAIFSEVLIPIAAVVAVVAAVALGFKLAYDHIKPFHDAVNNTISSIKQVVEALKGLWQGGAAEGKGISILDNLGFSPAAIGAIQNVFARIKEGVAAAKQGFENVKSAVQGIFMILTGSGGGKGIDILQKLGFSKETIKNLMTMGGQFKATFDGIKNAITSAITGANNIVRPILDGLLQFWNTHQYQFRQTVETVWKAIGDFIRTAVSFLINTIGPALSTIYNWWVQYWPEIQQVFQEVWNVIIYILGPVIDAMKTIIQAGIAYIKGAWQNGWAAIGDIFRMAWDIIKGVVQAAWAIISGIVSVGLDILTGNFRKAGSDFVSALKGAFDAILGMFKNLIGDALDFGSNFVQSIAKGITGAIGSVVGAAQSVVSSVQSAIGSGVSSVINGAKSLLTTPHFATGTDNAPGGLALVGEEGPELVNLPRGSQVFTASQTKAAFNNFSQPVLPGGSGGNVNYYITVNANGNITRNEHELGQIVSRAILNQTKMQGRI